MARFSQSHSGRRGGRAAAVFAIVFVAVACGLAVFTPEPPIAHASLVRALALEDLTRKADMIVLGTPTEQQARRHIDGKLIVTDYSVQVDQALKGDAKRGKAIVMTVLGGTLDGIAVQVPGEAGLELGKRVLLFLYRAPMSGDLRAVGMSQGVMPLVTTGGQTMVQPGGSGAALVELGSDGQMHDAPPALMAPQPLGDLLDRITKIVASQK
jgi:hypothetical protein